jgi:hypothetical protein
VSAADDERREQLDDYVSGHMNDGDAASFEAELFAAAGDAPAAGLAAEGSFVDDLIRMTALYVSHGGLVDGATRAHVDALYASGARVHYVDLTPRPDGQPIPFPAWGPNIDVVVARIGVDLRGHGLVDVENFTADGRPIKTFRDVACDPADGAFYAICQERLAQLAFGRGRVIAHFISKQGGKRERVATLDVLPTR